MAATMIHVLILLLKHEFPKRRILRLDRFDRLLKTIALTADELFDCV